MNCHKCGAELRENARFCGECGEKQGRPVEAVFSEEEIAEIQQKARPDEFLAKLKKIAEEGFEVEQRGVAVLCVSLSGYSNLCSRLSKGQLREVMRDVYSTVAEVIAKREGYVDKLVHDEVTAIFGIPIGLERPCERVIAAVDEVQIGLAGVNHRFKDILPAPLSVCAGVAFGKVLAGRLGDSMQLEYSALEETLNVAKRLADAALSGAVFVTKEIADRAEEAFEFQSVGEVPVSEAEAPVEVLCLVGPRALSGERPRLSKLAAPMFGRDKEFSKLKEAFGKLARFYPDPELCKTGEGKYRHLSRIFGVTGEAGVGKSRLKREFKRHLGEHFSESGFRWLVGGAWSVGETPLYWPIKAQMASELGFDPTAGGAAISAALSRLKEDMGDDAELVAYLYYLFGVEVPGSPLADLDPKAIKDNLWMAIRRLYARWSAERPLVLVFEDMHWSDGGTADFLDYLADFVSDFPILVLILYRPGFEAKFAKRKGVPFTELRLEPLSSDAEAGLLDFYVAGGERERAFARRLRRYSGGNPLLVEESLHLLLEQGKLELVQDKMRLAQDVEEMPLPAGLPEVLAERFDRLPQQDKRVAYSGAVIGDSFATDLLSSVQTSLYGASDVDKPLESLVEREFLFQRPIGPELEFIFKHDVMRDLMISRQATSLRREQSKLVAAGIEDSCRDHLDEFQGILAMHWEMAGEMDRAARSAAFWAIYNRKQQRYMEAKAAFENCDRLCETFALSPLSPQEESDLLVSRMSVLEVLGQWDEAIAFCDVSARFSDAKSRAIALRQKAVMKYFKGDYDQALRGYDEALALFRELGDEGDIGLVLSNIGTVHWMRDDYDEALRYHYEGLALFREVGHQRGIAFSINNIGLVHLHRGEYDEAIGHFKEALSMFRQLGDQRHASISLNNMGTVHIYLGNYEEALRYHHETLLTRRELGDRHGIASSLANISIVHNERGEYDQALQYNNDALSIFRELGDRPSMASCFIIRAGSHSGCGDYQQALECYNEVLSTFRDVGNQADIALALISIADLHADRAEWAEVKKLAAQAEEISRSVGQRAELSGSLSKLCRAEAGLGNWDASLCYGAEALSVADEVQHRGYMVNCRMALSEAHLQMARWYDGEKQSEKPPLSRDDALAKATDYANQAKELAEEKGMKAYARMTDELLAKIAECSP